VKAIAASAKALLLTVDLGELAPAGNKRGLAEIAEIGDSIAVNGVCLTITTLDGALATFDVSAETLAKSALDRLRASSQVNVERAVRAADRFGGHFVQGHIDGTATIKAIERRGEFADMKFAAGPELLDQMVVKGSVAVDGISLTIAGMDKNTFTIALIPQTLKKTTLGKAKIGDLVNIEADIIVKTIKKQLEKILPQNQTLTAEKLRELGF